jgi:hypothetical protein
MQKVFFLAVNASLLWLNNVSDVYLVQVSLAFYWSALSRVWDISSGIGDCFPLAGGLCKFYANAGGKRQVQRQLLLVKYKQQPIHFYQCTIMLHLRLAGMKK